MILAVVMGTVQIVGTIVTVDRGGLNGRLEPDLLGYALLVLSAAALVGRRQWPVGTAVAAVVPTVAWRVIGYVNGPGMLAMVAALVSAVLVGRRLAAWLLALGGVVAYGIAEVVRATEEPPVLSIASHVGWLLVFLLGAEMLRAHREIREDERRRAEVEQRRRASEERMAIARELHDVVAHSIAVINVQAGTALHLRNDTSRAFETLATIRKVSADTLRDLRQALGVLRGDSELSRLPTRGLHALDDLVTRAESAGLSAEVTLSGALSERPDLPLPTAVSHAAYRIVQEAVTNVVRHSGSPSVRIDLSWVDDRLELAVLDEGRGLPPSSVDGNGIRGMRERVAALDGTISVLTRPEGGCAVRAVIPAAVTT